MDVIIREYPSGHKVKEYRLDGNLHNPDGPAVLAWYNGMLTQEEYWLDGELHNDEGPACITWNNGVPIYKGYWLNGMIHNEEGPAILHYNDAGELIEKVYVLDGFRMSENQWRDQTKPWEILEVISILHKPVALAIIEDYCRA